MFIFVESSLFTQIVYDYLSEEEFSKLQRFLVLNPEAGDVIQGSGGVRKLRWPGSGRGKRGGILVVYFLKSRRGEIWLLTLYAKNVQDDISPAMLRRIKKEIDREDES